MQIRLSNEAVIVPGPLMERLCFVERISKPRVGRGALIRRADIQAQGGRGEKKQDQGGTPHFGLKWYHLAIFSFRYLKICTRWLLESDT